MNILRILLFYAVLFILTEFLVRNKEQYNNLTKTYTSNLRQCTLDNFILGLAQFRNSYIERRKRWANWEGSRLWKSITGPCTCLRRVDLAALATIWRSTRNKTTNKHVVPRILKKARNRLKNRCTTIGWIFFVFKKKNYWTRC